ncbi:MAG: DUF1722 domain-containing protein [Thermoplasmatales archaeon]|nr:MAG: DUF1722 domain-containing protein [Thermoplasmatales archaeon]
MNNSYTKPNILISRCIEFDNCRYNSQKISSDFVKKLNPYVNFIKVCPELEIGLGVPRNPIRVIENKEIIKLIQPETKKDVTNDMIRFSKKFLKNLEIDGAILKSKSPSCGIKDVKIYPTIEKSAPLRKSKGFFGSTVIEKYPLYAIEDEDRLRNHIIKEHFLRKIFLFASFRVIKDKKSIKKLINFHSINKFLIMSYNQKELKELGNITANNEKKSIKKVLEDYEIHLKLAFSKSPRCTSNINVLQHTFGYISKDLKSKEKNLFIKSINDFRKGHIGLSVPISLMKSWIIRFDQSYLSKQTYFSPYPDELVEVENINFCAARDYWK